MVNNLLFLVALTLNLKTMKFSSAVYEFRDKYSLHHPFGLGFEISSCSHIKDKSYNKIVMHGTMNTGTWSSPHTETQHGLYFFNLETNKMEDNWLPIPTQDSRGNFKICT